jgi:hypothetical protein
MFGNTVSDNIDIILNGMGGAHVSSGEKVYLYYPILCQFSITFFGLDEALPYR